MIARLEGVQWAQEAEHGVFSVGFAGERSVLAQALQSLAADQGAELQSCEPLAAAR